MNLQHCWFRFQHATTKPSKWHSTEPSHLAVTQHSLCLIESHSVLIKNCIGLDAFKNRPALLLFEQKALLAVPGRG